MSIYVTPFYNETFYLYDKNNIVDLCTIVIFKKKNIIIHKFLFKKMYFILKF